MIDDISYLGNRSSKAVSVNRVYSWCCPRFDPHSYGAVFSAARERGTRPTTPVRTLDIADIGHVPPQMLLINGARASFELEDGRATVVQQLA